MERIIHLVERSNQRGGRMLSVIDLIERGTLTRGQAVWLLDSIARGSSWLVGARPGGAGKTAVMSALLAMLPPNEPVRLTTRGDNWQQASPGECLVAYEISPGGYEAYIWGEDVRRFAALGAAGCRLVTNLHADTLEQARQQLINDNGVPEDHFNAFDIFLPITITGYPPARNINAIWYFEDGCWREFTERALPSPERSGIDTFIDTCLHGHLCQVEEVRHAWLEFLHQG